MAIRDFFKFPLLPWRTTPLSNATILRGHDAPTRKQIISAASDPHPRVRPIAEGNEFGASGTENFGGYIRREDFNPELDNFVTAVKIYDKMRTNDAQIKAMLSVIKLPLRGATWTCIPPERGDDVDQQIADFVNDCLFSDDAMDDAWDDVLRHILLMLDFGSSVFEIVWRVEEDGTYRIKRLAPRLPKTIRMWNVDRYGKLLAVIQYAPVPVSTVYPRTGSIVPGSSHRDVPLGGLTPGAPTAANPQVANVHYSTATSFQYLVIPADYCLAIHERVLTADLRWVPSGEVKVGDRLLAFDEQAVKPAHRRWKFTDVTHSERRSAPCVRVHLEDGSSVVCTPEHPWLVSPVHGKNIGIARWVRASDLLRRSKKSNRSPEYYVLRAAKTWEPVHTYEAGWLAGIFDGEGNIHLGKENTSVSMAQVNGSTQSAVCRALTDFGFEFGRYKQASTGQAICEIEIRGGFSEHMRFLGTIRPNRLIENFQRGWHDARGLRAMEKVRVIDVEHVGVQEIQTISTSAHTYVGEGFLMHNCCVFSLDKEGDNYAGRSLLRSVYRSYYFKDNAYHLEGVRLDRFGVGIPVAQLEEGHNLNQNDLDALVEVLEAVRSNERAYLIAPPHVTYDLLPRTGSQTAGSGATQWIDHHDQQIARNVLAGFLTMGQDTHGTLGFGSRLTDMFVSSLNGVAAGICATLKRQVVTKLVDLNFDMTNRKYPRVTCRDLEQADLDKLVTTLGALVGTFITPDDDTESLLRKLLKLPSLDKNETRKAKAEAGVPATPDGGSPEYPIAGTKAADQSAKAGEKAAEEGKPPGGGAALPGMTAEGGAPGEGAPGPGLPPPGGPPAPAPADNPLNRIGTRG